MLESRRSVKQVCDVSVRRPGQASFCPGSLPKVEAEYCRDQQPPVASASGLSDTPVRPRSRPTDHRKRGRMEGRPAAPVAMVQPTSAEDRSGGGSAWLVWCVSPGRSSQPASSRVEACGVTMDGCSGPGGQTWGECPAAAQSLGDAGEIATGGTPIAIHRFLWPASVYDAKSPARTGTSSATS